MDQNDSYPGSGTAGSANTPSFGSTGPAARTSTDHQIPETTPPAHGAAATSTTIRPGGSTTGGSSSTGGSTGEQMNQKASQALGQAEERVNQGMKQAADRLEQAAGRIDTLADERLSGTGAAARAGDMAHTVADTMESMAGYLRSNDAQGLRSDLETQVRNKPLQTLLIGVAAGWLVGKILR